MPEISQLLTLAVQHHQAGRLRAAEQVYRQILADEPNHADACHLLGVVAFQLGDSEAAIEHIGRAVRLQATNAAYHNSLGAAMRAQGRLKDAVAGYRRALELKPDYFDAHNNLGNALKALGRLKDAAASYRRALALEPDRLDVHNKLGNTLQALGELDDALASYRRALELKPDYAEAYSNLGNTLQALGKSDEALASYRRALELKPDYAEAYNNLGNTLQALGKSEEALASYRRALELRPDYAGAYNNLGNALQAAGKLDEALACLRRALQLQPNHADAHNNLGNVLRAQGKLEDAVASYRRALELQPDHAETHSNLGNALKAQGELHAAQACYRRALELRPGYAEAHHNQALLWLLHGDLERGWPEYEWRWRQKGASPRPCRWPRWGGEPLAGKTILLYTEQGLGDTIQFIRFAPLVQSRGARVVFECPGALHRLLTGFRGIDDLILPGSPLPDVDVQAPLLSLPGILGTTLATIPADVPYLQAAPELVERWRSELSSLAGLKIGVCWQGSPQYKADRDRSFPLTCLEPIGQCPGVQLISLQKGAGSEQLRAVEGRWFIHDWGSRLDESTGPFMDTAAVMMSLDLVISADTAVAHLAGALGVPVWLALTRIPHWPWMLDREDSPWYPTMRLFRQRQLGDWADVFVRLSTALRERVALAGPRPALGDGLDVRSREAGAGLTPAEPLGPDLQSLVDAWPSLPGAIRAAIVTLVKAGSAV